ncbi:hypothetical protein IMG5_170580 [Ichthyophthirius multifiliis]|uniref:EF-hand domain-containing protein n=1 Tax=Ichthyophthirius multifiliis TaxID=5932 RepID=G0R1H3_ICHMU|nr:hypothetical protein IMG5_170580 [Ichthyophthirius multifiliis]EGR28674.1 hypothetical protein IMG5_170580 [Ichthyophthirius multifiliis]|eukprot:XP_004029910.1 hypothetical protein IMG5_170580 [Ichthyophthirius multifiliis]
MFFPCSDVSRDNITSNICLQQKDLERFAFEIRTLTLRQLKETIEEIYNSKENFDKKYQEAQLPRETMEQHMYSFLNQKYGLKNIIIEWATAIINGVRKYSKEYNDIAVFGKILRNECDEEFRFVQKQVKKTTKDLLNMYLKGKYPYKNTQEIKQMLEQKIQGWIFAEECIDIINYMYNKEDAEILIENLKYNYKYGKNNILLQKKNLTKEEFEKLKQEKSQAKIEFYLFQNIILDYQLKCHEAHLNNFVLLFRQVDRDQNGVINENEFNELLFKMGILKDELDLQNLLNQIDPFNKQQVTFSQCITLFSQVNFNKYIVLFFKIYILINQEQITDEFGNKMSYIQKIQNNII